jgi:hypothetical protein
MQYAVWFVDARLPISRRSRGNIDGPPNILLFTKSHSQKVLCTKCQRKKNEKKRKAPIFAL